MTEAQDVDASTARELVEQGGVMLDVREHHEWRAVPGIVAPSRRRGGSRIGTGPRVGRQGLEP